MKGSDEGLFKPSYYIRRRKEQFSDLAGEANLWGPKRGITTHDDWRGISYAHTLIVASTAHRLLTYCLADTLFRKEENGSSLDLIDKDLQSHIYYSTIYRDFTDNYACLRGYPLVERYVVVYAINAARNIVKNQYESLDNEELKGLLVMAHALKIITEQFGDKIEQIKLNISEELENSSILNEEHK